MVWNSVFPASKKGIFFLMECVVSMIFPVEKNQAGTWWWWWCSAERFESKPKESFDSLDPTEFPQATGAMVRCLTYESSPWSETEGSLNRW